MEKTEIISRYFREGKLHTWPKKQSKQQMILQIFHDKFTIGETYSEKEINSKISPFYDDYSMIRRYLVDYGYLVRDKYGYTYKKSEL